MDTSRVDAIVRQILSLTREEQGRVARIVSGLDAEGAAATDLPADEGLADEVASITVWLETIALESPWIRLQLIQDAHDNVSSEAATECLDATRRTLLEEHPAVAVRASVTDLAQRQPAAVIVGVIGLVSVAVGVTAKLFRLAF